MMAIGKRTILAVLICAFFVSSSFATVAHAQTTLPALSVPGFTLTYVDNSYDVKPTATVDPYTGANVTVQGYHVKQANIVLSIKNQPSLNNGSFQLYYNVRSKGHFEEGWHTKYYYSDSYNLEYLISYEQRLSASGAEYTLTSFDANYSANAQIDFQVQALLYNYSVVQIDPHSQFPEYGERENMSQLKLVATSDWSNTQTITIPEPSNSATESPSPEPTLTPTATLTPNPSESLTPTPSLSPIPILTPTPQIIVQFVPTWFYFAIVGLVALIAVLLGVTVSVLRRKQKLNP